MSVAKAWVRVNGLPLRLDVPQIALERRTNETILKLYRRQPKPQPAQAQPCHSLDLSLLQSAAVSALLAQIEPVS